MLDRVDVVGGSEARKLSLQAQFLYLLSLLFLDEQDLIALSRGQLFCFGRRQSHGKKAGRSHLHHECLTKDTLFLLFILPLDLVCAEHVMLLTCRLRKLGANGLAHIRLWSRIG